MGSTFQFSITEIERESGIGRDTLRVWERRYGFPAPERNQRGDRLYSAEQLDRLRLLKQLLDRGMRPGRIIGLDLDGLRRIAAEKGRSTAVPAGVAELMALLAAGSHDLLSSRLHEALRQQGLRRFLTETVAPMNHAVGEAWFAGRIGIAEEHDYAEQVRQLLTIALHGLPPQEGGMRVLLTTFPGESHGIGLLMAACMLSLEGARPILLGTQTPLDEIVRCAVGSLCRVVGISCSGHMGRRAIISQMTKLRKLLPEEIALWAGGSGVAGITVPPGDIRLCPDLKMIPAAVRESACPV